MENTVDCLSKKLLRNWLYFLKTKITTRLELPYFEHYKLYKKYIDNYFQEYNVLKVEHFIEYMAHIKFN